MQSISLPTHDAALPLGKESSYPASYDARLLYPIKRSLGRKLIGLANDNLSFIGWDLWRAYELSWLNSKGLPKVGLLKAWVPATSPNIVESKSFKLYLNSLNNEPFANVASVAARIEQDLTSALGLKPRIEIVTPEQFASERIDESNDYICVDDYDLEINQYQPDANLLKLDPSGKPVSETVFSRLLKSNCPVTGQPDWGTVHVTYSGYAIDHASLLRYIVSFRQHQGFHQQCVEQIFCDIMKQCKPSELSVYARYTRRGGIDISPWRATPGLNEPTMQRSAQQ